ncbi:helix-turn-helix domain-containing protein [Ramlibacter sp. AN1133]|uniref:helix-turn-helix domain-containing protein n=1 Tax=Ramlibacter sp. AN1133 TaxID=3133429 RepID=UPI0030BD5D23
MPPSAQPIVTPDQLASLLQGRRKSRKLSQAQLAARLGLSQNRLSELERDPGTLSVEQLLALCAQLGLQLTLQARDETGAPPPPPATDW